MDGVGKEGEWSVCNKKMAECLGWRYHSSINTPFICILASYIPEYKCKYMMYALKELSF